MVKTFIVVKTKDILYNMVVLSLIKEKKYENEEEVKAKVSHVIVM